jgi:hypothetical protein
MPLLRQHPSRTNGRSIYYVGLGELAVEVSFPDALDSEVRQIVYTFTGHEPSKILIQQGRKLLNQAWKVAGRVPAYILRVLRSHARRTVARERGGR